MLLQSFWPHSSQTCHSVSAEFLLSVFSVRLWFKYFFHFHPYLGKISNLTSIFFRWVEIPTRFDTPTGGTANTWANSLGFREVIDEMMMKWWNDRRFFFSVWRGKDALSFSFWLNQIRFSLFQRGQRSKRLTEGFFWSSCKPLSTNNSLHPGRWTWNIYNHGGTDHVHSFSFLSMGDL